MSLPPSETVHRPDVDAPPEPPQAKRERRRIRAGAIAAAAVLLGAAALAVSRGGRTTILAKAAGEVRQIRAGNDGLYWIDHSPGSSRVLHLRRKGAEAQSLAQGEDLAALALDGPDLFVLDAGTAAPSVLSPHPRGRLLRVSQTGGAPAVLAEGLLNPSGLRVDGGDVYWTETLPARAPAVPHVPALRGVSLLRSLPRGGGAPRLVARIEATGPSFAGQLIGRQGGDFAWIEPRRARVEQGVTLLRTAAADGGLPQTRWTGQTRAYGRLTPDALYLTDASTEASPAESNASVHRQPLDGGERILLTDWLPPGGWLLSDEKAVYCVGESLWRVPPSENWPEEVLTRIDSPPAADIARGFLYYVAREETPEPDGGASPGRPRPAAQQLVRRPLTTTARLRNALGLP